MYFSILCMAWFHKDVQFHESFTVLHISLLGNKTPDSLRTNLRNALREGDKGKLDRVIDECVAAGMPELDSDIERARKALGDMRQSSTG